MQIVAFHFQSRPKRLTRQARRATSPSINSSQINLAWTDNSGNETGFKVERATDSAFTQNLTLVTTTAANAVSYSNTGLTASTTYYYRIRATNSAGDSVNSNLASATTRASAPTVATTASATLLADGKTIALSVLGTDGLGESNLTYTWSAIPPVDFLPTFSINGTNAAKTCNATVSEAGSYGFFVVITNAAGLSTFSLAFVNVAQRLTTLSVSPSTVTLAAGAGRQFTATATDQFGDSMSASAATWAVSDPGGGSDDGTISSSGNYTAPTDNGGTFTVAATLGSAIATASVTVAGPAPTNLTASVASPTEIDLSWGAAAGAISYSIEMDDGDGTGLQAIDSVNGSATSYQATGLDLASDYSFCVVANFSGGGTTASNTASANTPDPVPQNLQATTNSTSEIDLNWSTQYSGEDGFAIEEEQSDGSWEQIAETAAGAHVAGVGELDEGTTYTFRVEAVYGEDESSPSNTASATTKVSAPSDANATAVQPDEANVTWTDNSSGEDGFNLTYSIDGSADAGTTIVVPQNGAGGATGYALIGLMPSTTYDVSITAFKGSQESDATQTSFTTLPTPTPPAPIDEGSVTPSITSGTVSDFGSMPAGYYKVVWSSGILNYGGSGNNYYGVGLTGYGSPPDDYYVQNGSQTIGLGGGVRFDPSAALSEAQANPPSSAIFHYDGSGELGVFLQDDYYGDNSGDGATWTLFKLPDDDTPPTVSISTTADPGLLTQPSGDSVSGAFTISRSMPNSDYSSDLSVDLNPWLGTALEGDGNDYTLYEQPMGWEGGGTAPTPPDPTALSSPDSIDIPANYSGVTVMAQIASTAVINPSGTIWSLLKAGTSYLVADAIAGAVTATSPAVTGTIALADGQSGIGGMVPTFDAPDAFVTPKAAGSFVTLQANNLPTGTQMGGSLVWRINGTNTNGLAQNPNQVQVTRDTPGRFTVQIWNTNNNTVVSSMDVWVIWATAANNAPRTTLNPATHSANQLILAAQNTIIWNVLPASMFPQAGGSWKGLPDFSPTSGQNPPPPQVPQGSTTVFNAGVNLSRGAPKALQWNAARQIRVKITNPNNIDLSGYKTDLTKQPAYQNYPDWPAEGVGNDNFTTIGESNNPDFPSAAGIAVGVVAGQLYASDNPRLDMDDADGANGNTVEVDYEYRDFARIQLGGTWFRVSDYVPWEVDAKFVKDGNGHWQNNGSAVSDANSW